MPKHNKTTEEENKNGKSRVAEVYPVPSGGGGGLFLPAVAVMSVKLLYGLERGVVENGWRRGRPTPLIYLHLQSPPCVFLFFVFCSLTPSPAFSDVVFTTHLQHLPGLSRKGTNSVVISYHGVPALLPFLVSRSACVTPSWRVRRRLDGAWCDQSSKGPLG